MKFKKYHIIITALSTVLVISCSEKEISQDNNYIKDSSAKTVFLRIETQSYSVDMNETVSMDKHPEFCTADVVSALQSSMLNTPTQPVNAAPSMESEDIPIWRYNSDIESVYSDGSVEFDMTSSIIDDEEINAILAVGASSIDFDNIPTRAVYSNGIMKLYSRDGTLLHSGYQAQPDMREFCDSMEHHYNQYTSLYKDDDPIAVKSGEFDMDKAVRRAVERFSGQGISGLEVKPINGKMLSVEYYHNNQKIKGVFSADLTQTYKSQIFTNGQLISQTISEYGPDNDNKYAIIIGGESISKNPQKIITQQLYYTHDNVPKVRTEIIGYLKNNISINLKSDEI